MTEDLKRTEFEDWFSESGTCPNAVERSGDGYKLSSAQSAWQAWQAAWNRRATPPSPSTDTARDALTMIKHSRDFQRLMPSSQKIINDALAAPSTASEVIEDEAASGSMEEFAEAADLVGIVAKAVTNGEALGAILKYRKKVRAAALASKPVAREVSEHERTMQLLTDPPWGKPDLYARLHQSLTTEIGMAKEQGKLREWFDAARGLIDYLAGQEGVAAKAEPVAAEVDVEAERKLAEQAYTVSAFDYGRDPIGSRDWTLFWSGYQAARRSQEGAKDGERLDWLAHHGAQLRKDPRNDGWYLVAPYHTGIETVDDHIRYDTARGAIDAAIAATQTKEDQS